MGGKSTGWAVVACAATIILSCGGTQTASEQRVGQQRAPSKDEAERAAARQAKINKELDDAVPKLWANMTAEERFKYMKDTVMPAMRTIFETYDPNRYAEMNCETCHGAEAEARKYAMPNPDLPKLSGMNDFAAARAKYPGAVEFMMLSVEPTMASLLQEPVYNAKTRKGFGCFRCHMHEDGGHGKPAASAPAPATTE